MFFFFLSKFSFLSLLFSSLLSFSFSIIHQFGIKAKFFFSSSYPQFFFPYLDTLVLQNNHSSSLNHHRYMLLPTRVSTTYCYLLLPLIDVTFRQTRIAMTNATSLFTTLTSLNCYIKYYKESILEFNLLESSSQIAGE